MWETVRRGDGYDALPLLQSLTIVVLDRSSSIDLNEYKEEKKFVQNFVASFSYSPLGVNLGITNFHAFTWDGPVTLAQGNNDASVSRR